MNVALFPPKGAQGLATCSLFAKGDARVGAARSFPSHILKKIIFLKNSDYQSEFFCFS